MLGVHVLVSVDFGQVVAREIANSEHVLAFLEGVVGELGEVVLLECDYKRIQQFLHRQFFAFI